MKANTASLMFSIYIERMNLVKQGKKRDEECYPKLCYKVAGSGRECDFL
jgi:hypothetical protein